MATTSSTSDIGTSEASEVEPETRSSVYDASVDTADDSEAGCSPLSLLSVLCQPAPSQLARKRKMQQNTVPALPPTGTKRCKGTTANDPKHVKPVDRVRQYPNIMLQYNRK